MCGTRLVVLPAGGNLDDATRLTPCWMPSRPPMAASATAGGRERQGAILRFGQHGSVGRAPRRNCVTAVSTSPSSRPGSIMPLLSRDVIPRTVA
ncbi:hypothetical protein RKD28_006568 [Streptomyces sp. SAI-229]